MKPIASTAGPRAGLLAVVSRTRWGWSVAWWYARDGVWRRGDRFIGDWREVQQEAVRQLADVTA